MTQSLAPALSLAALLFCASPDKPEKAVFEGRFFRGAGDIRYLELLEISRRLFEPDPEYQNLAMLYVSEWNGFVEGPTWNAWWIQNSYGTTYCALPFLAEPYLTFLQNSHDLWFDQMGDGRRIARFGSFEWIVPDGQLCDAAAPGMFIPKQGDGRVEIHDWGVEFTAAGLLLQAELLLISREPAAIERYLPRLERCANFLETRRDPSNDLFLAGPAGNLLAPSYAGWKRPDGTYAMAYLAGLSVTYIAALDRLVELERLAGREAAAQLYAERRERARRALPKLLEPEGYFVKSIDPDGTRHGVYGAPKHGYFEAVVNHDAICFRVADDELSRKIYEKIASIPGLRPHGVVITNYPSLDDMYVPPEAWLWRFGTWVNGGHWSTCEARMIMGYYRLGKHDDARRSLEHLLGFAREFRMDNPLVEFGKAVYQPGEAINLCYDNFGPPAAMIRGLFEYLYDSKSLTLLPHIPAGITRLEQRFPVRFGRKRLWLATYGSGPISSVLVDGKPHQAFDSKSVRLAYDALPERAVVQIALGGARPEAFEPERDPPRLPRLGPDRTAEWTRARFPPIAANELPLRIGADSHGGSRFLGEIARARVFARALSAAEILALAEGASELSRDPSLVVDLAFGETSGGIVPNAAKKELPAKLVGKVAFADSPRGKAAVFEGEGYLEIPDCPELDLAGACTLEAWIAPRELPPGGARIIDKSRVGASDGYLLDTCPGNSLRLICERGTLVHDSKLAPGHWVHVAATVSEDGTLALYLEGRLVASEKRPVPPALEGLHERAEKALELAERLEAEGRGETYEAAHARLAARYYETCAERFRLLGEGKLPLLPPRSQYAADLSYVSTTRKLCEGLERALERKGASAPKTVRILKEQLSERPIDPKQGGQFIEPLCGLLPSLIAQQVASTSFEDEPPWNVEFRREVDRPHRPWYPEGAVHVAKYARDPERPFNGAVSLRIEISAAGAEAGISQDGYCLEEGRAYKLRLHMRGKGRFVARASLHGGGSFVAGPEDLGSPGEDWGPAEAVLRARRSISDATLTISFSGPGTLWIDRVYLIEEGAVLGLFRRDVVEAIRAMQPGVIRFGGSALETYEWEKCVGPWDARAPFRQEYWGGLEENFVGVEEFVQLCREVGAEPLVCVRWSGKKPEDAAAEVEYFNGAPESTWGALRARNGRREPYGVKYWQVGNEVGGAAYDRSVRAFAEAMRRVDPTIRVLSSFPSEDTLREAAGAIDYLCPHHYGCADLAAMAASFGSLRDQIARFGRGRDIRVAVTEWNTTAGDWGLGRASLQTLGNALACARYHNLLQRNADLVEIAIRSNLIDSFSSGAILVGPGWLYVSPAYHAQRLYARAAGSRPLRLECPEDAAWPEVELDLSATLSEDRKTLRIYAVNPGAARLARLFRLEGLGRACGGTRFVLADAREAGTPEVLNLRDDPERVSVRSRPIAPGGAEFIEEFSPYSLTLLEIELAPREPLDSNPRSR